MKPILTAGVLGLSLLAAGCGDSGNTNQTGGAPKAAMTPAPNGGEWSEVVTETPEGGFLMGNPNAPVKLVEFASLTCGHCAKFSAEGAPEVIDKYVRTGQVSFELRNYVRDPADLAAALLSRCGGARPYFQLTDQLFAAQAEWLGRLQEMPPAVQEQLKSASSEQAVATLAEHAGLVQFVRVRGVPSDKANACLADKAALQKLVDMNSQATQKYQLTGTPSFLINDQLAEASDWENLQPKLQAAVGQ